MANTFSDFGTLQLAARNDISQAPNHKQYGGNLKWLDVKFSSITPTTSDVLFIARLPAGARLIPELCSVDYTAPSSTAFTGKIGYYTSDTDTPTAVNDAAFGTALALGTAAGRKMFSEAGTIGTAFITPIQFTTDVWITFTPTTVTAGSSHNETWHIAYALA